ncbi:MAG: hypothetical protein DI568_15190 [Sphingomonas sp.]|nr:MAG: hypothetical protein DI568_15190 [Sphingomonas sp.]
MTDITEIQKAADSILFVCGHTATFDGEAWSKAQLLEMLARVQSDAQDILVSLGVSDMEAHYEKLLEKAHTGQDPSFEHWKPYAESK